MGLREGGICLRIEEGMDWSGNLGSHLLYYCGVVGPAVDTVSLSMTIEASEVLSPFPGSPQTGSLSYVFSRCSRSWWFYIPVNRTCFSFFTHLSQDPW